MFRKELYGGAVWLRKSCMVGRSCCVQDDTSPEEKLPEEAGAGADENGAADSVVYIHINLNIAVFVAVLFILVLITCLEFMSNDDHFSVINCCVTRLWAHSLPLISASKKKTHPSHRRPMCFSCLLVNVFLSKILHYLFAQVVVVSAPSPAADISTEADDASTRSTPTSTSSTGSQQPKLVIMPAAEAHILVP